MIMSWQCFDNKSYLAVLKVSQIILHIVLRVQMTSLSTNWPPRDGVKECCMLLVIRSGSRLVISHCLGHTSCLQSLHWDSGRGTEVVTNIMVIAIHRHFLAWSSHTNDKVRGPLEIVRVNLVFKFIIWLFCLPHKLVVIASKESES